MVEVTKSGLLCCRGRGQPRRVADAERPSDAAPGWQVELGVS